MVDEEIITSEELIDLGALNLTSDNNAKEITKQIVEERNPDNIKNLIHIFNLNQTKKNALRVIKMNQLLDGVSDEMIRRFQNRPNSFNNDDLLKYLQVTENAIDRANKSLANIDNAPTIQINQVNVGENPGQIKLDRESRDKTIEAAKALLKLMQNSNENDNTIEVNSNDVIIENKEGEEK